MKSGRAGWATGMAAGRRSSIPVAARVVLTPEGESFYMNRSRGLHRFESVDGSSRYGFRLPALTMPWLKKLLSAGFVEKIEIQASDIVSIKDGLSDFMRLVAYHMARLDAGDSLVRRVYDSELIRRWNRSNPKRAIGPGVRLQEGIIRSALSRSPAAVAVVRRRLFELTEERIRCDDSVRPEDRSRRLLFGEELVSALDPIVLFVLAGSLGEERGKLMEDLSGILVNACARIEYADMLALMGVELAGAAERSALVRALRNTLKPEEIRQTLAGADARSALLERGDYRGITVAASLDRPKVREGSRLRFRFSFYDDGPGAEELRKLMEDVGERMAKRRGLKALSTALEDGSGIYGDDGLSCCYLGFLQECCDARNIHFESRIAKPNADEMVVTTLAFGL